MNGVQLQFFVHEGRRLHGRPLYRWLLDSAEKAGVHGGSAFKAMAGFGRHGILREEHFFELAGELPVAVVFIVSHEEADLLLAEIAKESVPLFYSRQTVEYGVVNG